MRFEGKRAVVLGGASGIGRAAAQRLADEGAEVWIGDIDSDEGEAFAMASGGRVHFEHADAREVAAIEALIVTAAGGIGIDILFNAVGGSAGRGRSDEVTLGEWDEIQAAGLRATMFAIRHAVPHMVARGGGAVVNSSSVSALQAVGAPVAHAVARAGVQHLTVVAAADLARHGIRVNAVTPGFIHSDRLNRMIGGGASEAAMEMASRAFGEVLRRAQPIQRAGKVEDVAAAVLFLASDEASFITGQTLVVDGGYTLGPRQGWDPDAWGMFESLAGPA